MSIEIEYNLTSNAVPDYAMYTELGNAGVHAIVSAARAPKMNWRQTLNALRELADSNPEVFGEAMDTMVREYVYDTLGFARSGEDFYV